MKLPSVDKSKMAASKMTGWSLKWLYLSYDSTQKGVVYVVGAYGSIDAIDSVKLTSVIFLIITRWRYPRWRYPNWRTFVVLHPCNTLSRSYIRSLYLTTTGTLLDSPPGSHFESIVPVVGGFQSLRICYRKRLVH